MLASWLPYYSGLFFHQEKNCEGAEGNIKKESSSVKWIFNQEMMTSGWFYEHDIVKILKVQITGKNFEYFQ